MMADASGFTRLTELLVHNLSNTNLQNASVFDDQKSGAEELYDILDRFFSQVVTVIQSFGGDIVKVSSSGFTMYSLTVLVS
jgi:class 3 adenylate cyclase